ncbi:MAG: hypothetical protein GF341_03375 [candidate division Zixibacteria bacterium]|nr:hypothetical protein [candidate division Zixibacteria bacterium]
MTRLWRQLVDIREGEWSRTLAMFTYILTVIAVLVIVKSVRQSLFLQKFGAANLPYVYLLIAAIAGTIATIYQRFAHRVKVHRLLIWTMVIIIANLLIFRFLSLIGWSPLAYVLYVWVAVYGILATAQFWMLANYVYDPRQAKRLFPILGVGATLGGILGGYITQFTATALGTENMLLLSGVMLLTCIGLAWRLGTAERETIREAERARRFKDSSAEKTEGGFKLIWESKYLKLVMAIIALSIVISTVVDNQFSFVVEEHIPDKDAKTAFFGQFFTWLGWAAFLTQFFLTARVVRRFGIGVAMAVLPVALFLGSGLFVLIPMLLTGVLVKIADGTFRYTIHKASLELLFLPIPIGVKNKTKTFIDVFTDRFSKGIAALLVLLVTTLLGFHYTILSYVLMGLAVVWIGVAVLTRKEYTAAFRDSLMGRKLDEDTLIISPTDPSAVDALAESLRTAKGSAARRLLDLVEGIKSPKLIDPLVTFAHDPDIDIAKAALDRLAEQDAPEVGERLKDLLESPNVEIVERVLRIRCRRKDTLSPVELGPFLADDRPLVRLGAVMCALRSGGNIGADIVDAETLEHFLEDSGGGQDRHAMNRMLASLLRVLPDDELAHSYTRRFLDSNDPEIRGNAIESAGRLRSRELVEPLIRSLDDRRLRYKVRDALAGYGESALGTIEDYFRDPDTAFSIRQYLPRVLERIPSQRSVDILVSGLDDVDARVRFASLRSLGRLRAKYQELNFDHHRIAERLDEEVRKAYRYQGWVLDVADNTEAALLRKTLHEKSHKTLDRLFRLLAMTHPPAELYAACQALYSPNARIRANAVEYLDNVLKPPHKQWVLGLIEERPSFDQISSMLRTFGDTAPRWPDDLEHQAGTDDDWLAACALYTVWALQERKLFRLFERDPDPDRKRKRPLTVETLYNLRQRIESTPPE